jgi:hypothetical protein
MMQSAVYTQAQNEKRMMAQFAGYCERATSFPGKKNEECCCFTTGRSVTYFYHGYIGIL